MSDDLRPYSTCKDSGAPWLGLVPAHWDIRRGRRLFRYKKELNWSNKYTNVLSLTLRGVVKNNPDAPEGLVPKDYATYQFFHRDDLVFKLIDLENLSTSRVGLVPEDGIMSPAYVRLVSQHDGVQRYFYHQYYDLYQRGVYNQLGAGVRSTLGPPDLLDLKMLVPTMEEQVAITRYLDHADRRIRRYIAAKKKLIALLNEQKQAIINRAVTRGVDPNVRLKPSGVEWIGDVPRHWRVSRLKFEASHIVDCLHATPEYQDDGEYPAIRTADIEPGRVRLEQSRRVSREQYGLWTSRLTPVEGDILYSREGERFGIAALVPCGVRLCISQRMMVFRIRPPQRSDFVMWQLNSRHVYAQAAGDVIGATAPHVNVERIKNYWIAMPPPSEQEQIVAKITDECHCLDAALKRAEQQIALTREYRTRLIADVVTGKLDVREAAANLPDEPEGPDALEEPDALGANGEDAEAMDMDATIEEDAT